MTTPPRIVIAWKGLPAYGARLIRAARLAVDEPVGVIATRPAVPVADVESILEGPVQWIDDDHPIRWSDLGTPPPALFIESSWATPAFNALTRQTKKAGGRVVCMVDNRWKNNLRQWLGTVYFRMRLRPLYDAAWVPGDSARQLCRKLGMPSDRIVGNLYSGWTEKFTPGPPLDERPKRILFVGQYVPRKGIDLLIEAVRAFSAEFPQWEVHLHGSGELEDRLKLEMPTAKVQPFGQTDQIAAAMRSARFFVMPSRDDHWPLAVHEAASSGCALVLSSTIGNAAELASPANAIIFKSGDAKALYGALREAACKDDQWLSRADAESRRRAGGFGPKPFTQAFQHICRLFLDQVRSGQSEVRLPAMV